jgi:hypothetical protein
MNRGDGNWIGVSVTVVSGSPTIRDILVLQNTEYYLRYNHNTSFPAFIAGSIQTIIFRLLTSLVKCRLTKNFRMNLRPPSLGLREFHPGRRKHGQSDSDDTDPLWDSVKYTHRGAIINRHLTHTFIIFILKWATSVLLISYVSN